MSYGIYTQEGIKKGLINITEDESVITYIHHNITRNYKNPEERVQAEIFCKLILWYEKVVGIWDSRNRATSIALNGLCPMHQYADNTMKKRRGSKSPTIDFCFKDWTTNNSYFGAEAKNLYESRPEKIKRYVSTGVDNYTKGKYGSQSSESSIIGYVLSGKIPDIASELKAEMAKETPIANLARTTSSNPQYKSCHLRTFDNQEITLHHLFFDFVSA